MSILKLDNQQMMLVCLCLKKKALHNEKAKEYEFSTDDYIKETQKGGLKSLEWHPQRPF